MGSNGRDETITIKIKTMDSETYSVQVNKQISIAELKEQIGSVTNVQSEQRRLIYGGQFLQDDKLLSAYNVEDGHTLHLVVKPPVAPSAPLVTNDPAPNPASSTSHGHLIRIAPGVGRFRTRRQPFNPMLGPFSRLPGIARMHTFGQHHPSGSQPGPQPTFESQVQHNSGDGARDGSLIGPNLRRIGLNFRSTDVGEHNQTSQGEVRNEAENADVGTSRQQCDVQAENSGVGTSRQQNDVQET